MSMAVRAMGFLEVLTGRRALWRLGRLMYRHARRDGNNSPEINGEYALHRKITEWASRRRQPFNVVDVGANIGYWSSNLLDECQKAGVQETRLWAFEPSGEIRSRLEARMAGAPSNQRIVIRAEAVSDEPGEAAFDATPGITGIKHLLTESAIEEGQTPSVDVAVTTLVNVFEEEGIETADFVKSDVEGFDLFVLRGARPLLEQGRIGLIQFEYNHWWISTRSFLRDVFDLAEDLPYHVCKVVPDGIDAYPSWNPELETWFEANFILVRDDLVEDFGVRHGTWDSSNTFAASGS